MNPDLIYQLALKNTPGIGTIGAKLLIAHRGGARAVFETPKKELMRIPGIGPRSVHKIHHKEALRLAEKELEFAYHAGIKAFSYLDEGYPNRLKSCEDGPVVLFQKGNLNLNAQRVIALVGSRKATSYGLAFCERFVAALKALEVVVISGLAYGIDICAHKEALKNNIPTAAVLAHGLDRIYPSLHTKIARQMLQEGGALLTEYPSGTNPDRENFPSRNRIVAGICDAVVIVEAARKGGALITAEIANSYNRDVFAVPGRLGDTYSEGCNLLIKTHKATIITTVKDLEYLLGWTKKDMDVKQPQLFEHLTRHEQLLVDCLSGTSGQPLALDRLCAIAKLPIGKVLSTLLNLELKGIVKNLPGKMYTLAPR